MARDILSEIARNALAPAPEGATPLEERIKVLTNALELTRRRVEQQHAAMAQLKQEMASYCALVSRMKSASEEAQKVAALLPEPRPLPISMPTPPASQPTLNAQPTLDIRPDALAALAAAPSARLPWTTYIPYAAIAVMAAVLSILASQRPARASLPAASVPPPSAALSLPDRSATASIDGEENNTEVLSLVYAYVPPGSKRAVRDILGPEIDSAVNSPWTIVRVDARTTLVSFRPFSEALETAPAYEFSVDTLAKTVTPSDETVQNLRGNQVAAR